MGIQGSLTPARRVDTSERQEVDHVEVAAVSAGQRWAPAWVVGQVRVGVALQEADDYLRDDAASDRSEVEAVLDQLGFFQHVVPEWCRVLEAVAEPLEFVEVVGAEGCDTHAAGEGLS